MKYCEVLVLGVQFLTARDSKPAVCPLALSGQDCISLQVKLRCPASLTHSYLRVPMQKLTGGTEVEVCMQESRVGKFDQAARPLQFQTVRIHNSIF